MAGGRQLAGDHTHLQMAIAAPGGPSVLQPVRSAIPEPGPEEILVRVAAAGVNRHDLNQRRAGPASGRSSIPGLEIAGRVEAVGRHVPIELLGRRVCALTDGGGYAEYAVAHHKLAFVVSDRLADVAAAAVPEALFTCWYNLLELAQLKQSEILLIHGGTSGVGSISTLALTSLGHRVWTTCGSVQKCSVSRSLGAQRSFDYNAPDLLDQIKNALGEETVGVVLDMSGGRHLAGDMQVLSSGGRVVFITPGNEPLQLDLRSLMTKQLWLTGSLLRPLGIEKKIEIAARIRDEVFDRVGHSVNPPIHRTFRLKDAAAAHAEMESRRNIGKIVLTMDRS